MIMVNFRSTFFLFLVLAISISSCYGSSSSPQYDNVIDTISCGECTAATDIVRGLIFANVTDDEVLKAVVGFCIKFKIENDSVCEGIVEMFEDEFFAVLNSELSSSDICGWLLGVCPYPNVSHHYNVTFPKPKPPHVPPVPPSVNGTRHLILHISDLHFDAQYTAGMNDDCKEPLCCRPSNGYGVGDKAAGKWGDYQCDLNIALLDNLVSFWQTMNPKPDYVFWTGDNPPHDIWMQTREGQINNSAFLAQKLKEAFGSVPVFPAIGNHESVPVNSYPLPPLSSWLLDALGDQWSIWLPESALETFRYGGYYVAQMRPGFQVISMNTNYCNDGNGWLLLNDTDPAGMLEWLVGVLQTIEDAKEKAYIIGHIPIGSHVCLPHWGSQFAKIVDRYEDSIIAQFYGHTHSDQFEVFYELNSNTTSPRATSIAYITPSVTTYQGQNPSYRIYTTDSASGYLTETSTYHVNITAANLNDNPVWELEYNATSSYSLPTLFPADWANLIEQIENDDTLLNLYYTYEDSSAPQPPCDSECRTVNICELKSATSDLLHQCLAANGVDAQKVFKNMPC